jgi:rhodanese-related sulfurtransferase
MKNPIARKAAILALSMVLTASLAACGGKPAAPEAAAAAPAPAVEAAAPAAQAIAMADTPQVITPQQFTEEFSASQAPFQLIDVRTPEEFASGHIAGSVNIPVQDLNQRLGEISKDTPVVLYCRSGNRSAQAAQILDNEGFTGVYDLGGIQAWQAAGLPVQQ